MKYCFFVVALVCALVIPVQATSESGSLSLRANSQFRAGRYPEAYALYERALKACGKEADPGCAARVRLNMALLDLHAGEFEASQILLDTVALEELGSEETQQLLHTRLKLALAQDKSADAVAVWNGQGQAFSKCKKAPRWLFTLDAAVAFARNGQNQIADSLFQQAAKKLDEEAPGQIYYAKARLQDAWGSVDSALVAYELALEETRKAKRFWHAGQILLAMGRLQLGKGEKTTASKTYLRAVELFEQLGLIRPFVTACESYVALVPSDKKIAVKLSEAKTQLAAPQEKASIAR